MSVRALEKKAGHFQPVFNFTVLWLEYKPILALAYKPGLGFVLDICGTDEHDMVKLLAK